MQVRTESPWEANLFFVPALMLFSAREYQMTGVQRQCWACSRAALLGVYTIRSTLSSKKEAAQQGEPVCVQGQQHYAAWGCATPAAALCHGEFASSGITAMLLWCAATAAT
jgi:hypothetical protein